MLDAETRRRELVGVTSCPSWNTPKPVPLHPTQGLFQVTTAKQAHPPAEVTGRRLLW